MKFLQQINFYAASKSNEFWLEIGESLAEGFALAGVPTSFYRDEFPPSDPAAGEFNVAVGGHEYFYLYLNQLSTEEKGKILGRMVALTGEQPGSSWFESNLHLFKSFLGAWDITAAGAQALTARGVKAWHVPLGIGSSLVHREPATQNTDVFFMGSLTNERLEFLSDYALKGFAHCNNIRLVELGYAKTREDAMYMGREQRNALVAQSRITLNIHAHLVNFFEWHRALIALANGSLFLTEPSLTPKPLLPGLDYVEVSRNLLQAAIDFFLSREDLRLPFVESVKNFARQHLPQARLCEIWARNFNGEQPFTQFYDFPEFNGIAARSRETSENSAIHSELKRHLNLVSSRLFVDFYRFSARSKESSKAAAADVMGETAKVKARREEVMARMKAEKALVNQGVHYSGQFANELWRNSAPFDVSVIISLYNYEHDISFALDSLLFACDFRQCRIEVIIVDDCSSDASSQVARDWLSTEALPARLFVKALNTGFISSRRFGLKEAQGRYVFVLDADNALLPMGLQRLYDLACSTRAAAAYGIIGCVDEGGKPAGLLSAYPWDVNRLLYSPYIDAMALFDREKMMQLGDYDMEMFQHGWFGWEDYEYWLRLASLGESVQFYPGFCGMYRTHSSSMINSTNLFRYDLACYLHEKYRNFIQTHSHKNILFGFEKKLFQIQKKLTMPTPSAL